MNNFNPYPESNPNVFNQESFGFQRQRVEFTPEEQKIVQDCSREGSLYRGLPLGAIFGVLTNNFLKPGSSLYNKKYGALPAAMVASMLGYIVGKLTYYPGCLKKLLTVPDGTFKRQYDEHVKKSRGYRDPPDHSYQSSTPDYSSQPQNKSGPISSATDIDIAGTGSFDTMSATDTEDYAKQFGEPDLRDQVPDQNFTSYEELRQRNRVQSARGFVPPPTKDNPATYNRPVHPQQGLIDPSPANRTKYGDSWE